MYSQRSVADFRPLRMLAFALTAILFANFRVHALITPCTPAAATTAALQACINTAAMAGDTARKDTVLVNVLPGTYTGAQIRINRRKNLWIIGDTTADELTQPRLLYQDRQHVYTDLDSSKRADTSAAGTYGQNNGTIWIYESDNVRLMGFLVDGNSVVGTTNTSGRIFAYGATLGQGATVEIRGNVGVNILLSRNVQLRYLSVTNTWDGISIISPNMGGAFAFPDPNDPVRERVATLPTSQAGRYGSHLVERCRIHDNTFGILFQRDWDLGSVIRNNLFWGNYLRHWGDPRTTANYVTNLATLDKGVHADRSKRSIAYTTVGGAFLMTDVALTPYRIHNNTFYNNATIFSGYYKVGTQHLFYNNLVGRPYQFFRAAVGLTVEATDSNYTAFNTAYTQTERTSEMLQYMSEHQRSNIVVNQDSIPKNTAAIPDYWSGSGGNMRLYNMRMIRTSTGGWPNTRSWSNDDGTRDSLGMTWVPDTTALGTIAQIADTGGIVNWVRHNMWAGAKKDPMDPNAGNWSPPWIPIQIRNALGDEKVFRNTSSFNIRWTLGLPLDTVSAVTSAGWLTPGTTNLRMARGWSDYEGTAAQSLPIGAYDATGKWAAPARRLVLRDTLIESVSDSMVKFRLNISGQGIADSQIVKLEVESAKFYNDVPVSDTFYNQGPLGGLTKDSSKTTTRVNSILSSKPWPLPYQFLSSDYNRAGYRVDDSLTRKKLKADNVFLARIGSGSRLPADSLYARAEVVLKATLTDGTVVYSNPGVFMFSRPRFQFDVKVYDAITGKLLPYDADGISQIAQAREALKIVIKAKTVAKLPVKFNGYANLQMGDAGGLHGPGDQLEVEKSGLWKVRHPNDTVAASFLQNDSIFDTLRALASPSNGTLIYRSVFVDSTGALLPYFIEGRSPPLKVVSGAIYQVTIDSIFRDTSLRAAPSYKLKVLANQLQAGRRDTVLVNGAESSPNIGKAKAGDSLRVVLQVRDKYGNKVLDSNSVQKGLYLVLAHVLAPSRYPGVTTDTSLVSIDSGAGSYRSVRLSFDSTGRAVAAIAISEFTTRSSLAALRASIVDIAGREIGTVGASRDSGVADTTWLRIDKANLSVQWTDSVGADLVPVANGWVGSWIPVRLKFFKDLKAVSYTGSVATSTLSPLHLHPAMGDTSLVSSVSFSGDSVTKVFWLRADDSVSNAWIKSGIDSSIDSVGGYSFRYPKVLSSSFHDHDCDGRIDSLVLKLDGPVLFRAKTGIVTGDSIDARFPHQHLSPSAKGVPERFQLHGDSVVSFAWTPGDLGFADLRANLVGIGNPLSTGKSLSYPLSNLRDLAPPVEISAVDRQSWASGTTDSLVVRFSESIDPSAFVAGAAPPFAVVRGGVRTSMSNQKLAVPAVAVDSGVYLFVIVGAAGLIQSGDSLVVEGTSVSDLAGNLSGTTCPNVPVPIVFNPRYEPTQGWVIDVDGDGNADSVHLGFRDSLGSLPEKILVRWGTPAETLTVTRLQLVALGIKTSDSTITVSTRGWHGQTIVIDGDTIRNAPRTVGPWDSAWFEGGFSREWLVDRVPPVVVRSRLKWNVDPWTTGTHFDTLIVDFSERVVGCAVGTDPSVCLTAQGVHSSNGFSTGSIILSASGTRWVLLVPRTATSVSPGDSLRATPKGLGGRLTDSATAPNVTGPKSPFVKVLGDPMPPRSGRMLDRNGDGRVDAVELTYLIPPAGKLPSFTFEWGDSLGSPVSLRADSSYVVDSIHWIVVLKTPGPFPATGYGPSSTKTNTGMQISLGGTYPFAVRDGAGPMLKPLAKVNVSSPKVGLDTIVVWPSEALRNPTNSVLLEFRRGGIVIPADSVKFQSAVRNANGSWTVIVGPKSPYRPIPGDETRLSTSGSVLDTAGAGNKPNLGHPWVALAGLPWVDPSFTPTQGYVVDVDGDGNADSVHLGFQDSLGTMPLTIFVKWGTPAETLTIARAQMLKLGVTVSDSVIASPTPLWRGQTIVIDGDTIHNAPRTVGPWDSAWFDGGKSREWLADRVPPVVIRSRLKWNVDPWTGGDHLDTLVVDFSESVQGCAAGTDPAKCLDGRGQVQAGGTVFPAGSKILAATGSRWVILMPRTPSSFVPGDSLRGTPAGSGGALTDGQTVPNHVGPKSPYVAILGDPAPPREGRMLDRNGDGKVDAVELFYVATPKANRLPSFEFVWADSLGTPVRLRSDSAYALDSIHWIAVLNTPGAFAATGYAPSGTRSDLGTQISAGGNYPFAVRDSVGPVLKPLAVLSPSSAKDGYDTIVVWPSEALRAPTKSVLLEFFRGGAVIAPDSVKFASATANADGSWTVVIGPASPYRPAPGDLARLSTSGSVTDTVASANKPHPFHPWVVLTGALRVPYNSTYRDSDKDGRIETATFDFASPVVVGTRIRVYDPAGSNTFREYVVPAADSGKTHIEFVFGKAPWGQDVTSLVKPDLGVLLAPATVDTSVYKGGKFNIVDRAEPVISWAKLRYTSDTSSVDTLVLKVSERIDIDPSKFPIRYRTSSDPSDTGIAIQPDSRYQIVYDSINGTVTILLKPFPDNYSNPGSGDSLRLSWSGVSDMTGNAPQAVAKWVEVVANDRLFGTKIHVTNGVVQNPGHAGERIEGNQFEIVARPATPDGSGGWGPMNGPGGTWVPGENTYTPGLRGSTQTDNSGTVVFIQTSQPTTIILCVYDNLGTAVGQITRHITKEMLASLPKSKIGMTDVGVLWKGQSGDGKLVGTGIYVLRLMVQRESDEDGSGKGKVQRLFYNKLINIGVHLKAK